MFYSDILSRAWACFCLAIIVNILSTLGLRYIHGGELGGAASSSRSYPQYNVLLQDLGAGSLLAGSCQRNIFQMRISVPNCERICAHSSLSIKIK
jgi:hypothetical protein